MKLSKKTDSKKKPEEAYGALYDAMVEVGVDSAEVGFDGYGDSGSVEDIYLTGPSVRENNDVGLKTVLTMTATGGYGAPLEKSFSTLKSALEFVAYSIIEDHHCGWENNAGAYGTITIDAKKRGVTYEHNERYESSNLHTYTFDSAGGGDHGTA